MGLRPGPDRQAAKAAGASARSSTRKKAQLGKVEMTRPTSRCAADPCTGRAACRQPRPCQSPQNRLQARREAVPGGRQRPRPSAAPCSDRCRWLLWIALGKCQGSLGKCQDWPDRLKPSPGAEWHWVMPRAGHAAISPAMPPSLPLAGRSDQAAAFGLPGAVRPRPLFTAKKLTG